MSLQNGKNRLFAKSRNKRFLVRPTEFESATFGVGVQRSIQLSYGRICYAVVTRIIVALHKRSHPFGVQEPLRVQLSYGRNVMQCTED